MKLTMAHYQPFPYPESEKGILFLLFALRKLHKFVGKTLINLPPRNRGDHSWGETRHKSGISQKTQSPYDTHLTDSKAKQCTERNTDHWSVISDQVDRNNQVSKYSSQQETCMP